MLAARFQPNWPPSALICTSCKSVSRGCRLRHFLKIVLYAGWGIQNVNEALHFVSLPLAGITETWRTSTEIKIWVCVLENWVISTVDNYDPFIAQRSNKIYSQSMVNSPRRHVVLHVLTPPYLQIFIVPSALRFRPRFMTFLTENNLEVGIIRHKSPFVFTATIEPNFLLLFPKVLIIRWDFFAGMCFKIIPSTIISFMIRL